MRIVYYRDKAGKITHHHDAPANMTEEQLMAEVEKFNKSGHEKTAHTADVAEGSLEEYLLQHIKEGRRYTAKTIVAAKDAIREALDAVESLAEADCRNCQKNNGAPGGAADGEG